MSCIQHVRYVTDERATTTASERWLPSCALQPLGEDEAQFRTS